MLQLQANRLLRAVMGLILCERKYDNKVLKSKNCKRCSDSVSKSSSLPLSTPPQNVPKLGSALSRGPTRLVSELLQRWQPNMCRTSLLGQSQFSHYLTMLSSLTYTLLLTSGTRFFGLPSFFRESRSLLLTRLWLYIRISSIPKFAIRNVLFCWDGIQKETKLHKLLAAQNTNSNNVSNEQNISE